METDNKPLGVRTNLSPIQTQISRLYRKGRQCNDMLNINMGIDQKIKVKLVLVKKFNS